jgi:hypothetical protein
MDLQSNGLSRLIWCVDGSKPAAPPFIRLYEFCYGDYGTPAQSVQVRLIHAIVHACRTETTIRHVIPDPTFSNPVAQCEHDMSL